MSRIDASAAESSRLSDRFDGYNMRLTDAMTESPAAASNSAPGNCFGSAYARGVLEVRQHVGVRDEGMRGRPSGPCGRASKRRALKLAETRRPRNGADTDSAPTSRHTVVRVRARDGHDDVVHCPR